MANIEQKKTEWGIVYRYRGDNYRFTLYVYNDDMKTMYLSNVRVNLTARKKGIGNDILVTAENEAKKYGADTIFLVVSKSSWVHDWYKRHGFVDFMIDKYKDYVWMQKQINQNEKDMTSEELYQQYLDEVGSLERYGSKNVITFDEWKWLKSTIENTRPICESELNSYKELLGHTSQDIDTLE